MSRAAVKEDAATVLGPLTGKVFALSVSNSSTRFTIHADMVGRYCSFLVDGDSCDIVFGGTSVSASYASTSSVSTEAITARADTGWHLEDGQPDDFIVPKSTDATKFAVKTSSGAAVLYIRPSGP